MPSVYIQRLVNDVNVRVLGIKSPIKFNIFKKFVLCPKINSTTSGVEFDEKTGTYTVKVIKIM